MKKNELYSRLFRYSIVTNFTGFILTFLLSSIFIYLRFSQIVWAFSITLSLVIFEQFVLYKYFINKYTQDISEDLEHFVSGKDKLDENRRTEILITLMKFPVKNLIFTFFIFISGTLMLCFVYRYLPYIGLDRRTALVSYIACVFSSFHVALFAHAYSEHTCVKYSEKLVRQGVNIPYLRQKDFKGISMKFRCLLYLVIPSILPNIINFFVLLQGYKPVNNQIFSPKMQITRIIIITAFSFLLSLSLWALYYIHVRGKTKKLIDTISQMLSNPKEQNFADTALSDELQMSVSLINAVIAKFRILVNKAEETGKEVLKTTDNLSVISSQVNSTSLEQSADLKAILTTMEDANALSQNISGKILNVSADAETTQKDIQSGLEILKQNIEQMEQINLSNDEILKGITNFTQKINSIVDVVDIISEIAEQTRIIAFNAELEAVSAGEDGKNFHVIAAEIRRLASGIMDSIHEIQAYIKTIQDASKALFSSSESATSLIHEEKILSGELQSHFNSISETSEKTFTRATDIGGIVDQQTSSFNQIVITLKQISSGIESFTVSTKTISDTANRMKEIASRLSNIEQEKA